jgi:hypothetical protein
MVFLSITVYFAFKLEALQDKHETMVSEHESLVSVDSLIRGHQKYLEEGGDEQDMAVWAHGIDQKIEVKREELREINESIQRKKEEFSMVPNDEVERLVGVVEKAMVNAKVAGDGFASDELPALQAILRTIISEVRSRPKPVKTTEETGEEK